MVAASLNGLILAGGRSERMGRDKAALRYHGRMQTHYLAELLKPFVDQLFISVRKEQKDAEYAQGLEVVTDHYLSPSPLNGIVSAMHKMPGISLLVVAVDMPHVNEASVAVLVSGRDPDAVATCFESPVKGGPDPLLAIWEAHAFAALEEKIIGQTAHVCPRHLLKSSKTHILRGQAAPHMLDNINTPEELAAFQKAS